MYNEGVPGGGGPGGTQGGTVPSFWTEGGSGGMGAGLIGTVVQTGAALYDSYQNRKTAKRNTDANIAAAKAEAELAYQRQLEMWGLKNQYDSPEAQMARLRAAGLSPHLMYQQGNTGNSGSFPQYQPADLRHQYQSMPIAPAISAILPMLMQVGSWMQDMRLKETQIDRGSTETERLRQLIDFLTSRNPQLLRKGGFEVDTADYKSNAARSALFQLEQSFRSQYGEELFNKMGSSWDFQGDVPAIGGIKRLEFLEKESKNRILGYDEKLKEAQSSWADMDITNPQAIIMMVLQGIMGMAGAQLRSPGVKASMPSGVRRGSRPQRIRRIHPARRVQMEKWRD